MTTKVDPAENPKVERHVRAFLKALNSSGGKPMETMSPAEARQVLVGAQKSVKVDLAPCDIEERTITQNGIDVSITIVRPAGLKEKRPVFMFFHGGGWVLGDFPTHERFVRDLVADSGYPAVFVNYTPRPKRNIPPQSTRPMPPPSGLRRTATKSTSTARRSPSWATASAVI